MKTKMMIHHKIIDKQTSFRNLKVFCRLYARQKQHKKIYFDYIKKTDLYLKK